MSNNKKLTKAKKSKNDEFYTQLTDIINEIPINFKDVIKTRIIYLRELLHEDGYNDSINLKSMESFVLFLKNNSDILCPHVDISPDNFISVRWDKPNDVTLVMEFLPSKEISFAAVFNDDKQTYDRYISGRSMHKTIMADICSAKYCIER